jgi:two-component SAPR family response regulator
MTAKENLTRFVIIDDDVITCLIFEKIIERAFNTPDITSFSKPVEALDYLKSFKKEEMVQTVVFVDLKMPVLNGWNLIKEIEELDEDIKQELLVFILSSSMDPTDIQTGKTNPIVLGYFVKPLVEEHLLKVMEFTKLMLC